MMRWLVVLVIGLALSRAGDARAQVFKPRQTKTTAKTSATSAKKTGKTPAAAPRKSGRTTGTARKGSKSRAARDKGRPSDLTPDADSDDDVVIITDEDEDP
jgi:hypothetical protein